jgi:16S rRNA (guanine527-N7)-methyltransferase
MEEFEGLKKSVQNMVAVTLTSQQLEAFRWYRLELISWNERFNLTAITDPTGIEVRHFVDSLSCLLAFGPQTRIRVIDIGTGAGFPGLPLKIVCSQIRLTLIEATKKKADFCRHVADSLGLEGVEVLHGRAEQIARDEGHRGEYDWALARAVAPLPVLVEYLLPFVKMGGCALAQKGDTAHAETQLAAEALGILGGRVDRLIPIELPGVVETRFLVLIDKIAETPEAYPRRVGIPSKRPLGGKKGS